MNINDLLTGGTGLIGLLCFGLARLMANWPKTWRFAVLALGHVLVLLFAHYDNWWPDARKNYFVILLADSWIIPAILRNKTKTERRA